MTGATAAPSTPFSPYTPSAATPTTATTSSPASSPSLVRRVVESARRFSHSSLWLWQSSFYESLGPFAFSSNAVPHFVTSNAFIAYHYALCIHQWLTHGGKEGDGGEADEGEDGASKQSTTPPVIVELGAGHGKLSFLVLSHLMELFASSSSSAPHPPFLYVATDVSPSVLSFLRRHPSLHPFIERGLLDVAHFDCELPQPLRLLCSGRLLDGGGEGSERPPRLFVVANYAFSALRADAWQVREGGQRLFEGKVALWAETTDEEELVEVRVDQSDPVLISRVTEEWLWEEVTDPTSHYPPPLQSTFTRWLRDTQREAADLPPSSSLHFLFPVSALFCLDFLLSLPRLHDVVLLTADKLLSGTVDSDDVSKVPHVAKHGSLSVMLHLQPLHLSLESYAAMHQLRVRLSSSAYQQGGVKVALMAVHGGVGRAADAVLAAFQGLRFFSPDAFSALSRGVREEGSGGLVPLPLLLALLRLSRHEVDVFYRHRHALLHHTTDPTSPLPVRTAHDLLIDCRLLMKRYYPLHYPQTYYPPSTSPPVDSSFSPLFRCPRDVAFELGRLCLSLGGWEEARRCFECSWRDAGHHSLTAYHLSVAVWELGHRAEAVGWAVKAEALGEGGDVVTLWKARLHSLQQSHIHDSSSPVPEPPS